MSDFGNFYNKLCKMMEQTHETERQTRMKPLRF